MRISGVLSTLVLALGLLVPLGSPAASEPGFQATIRTVDEETRAAMIGVSWKPGCPVPIDDLRIIEMNFVGFDGAVHSGGQLMVHRLVAQDVVAAFRVLFEHRFPIRRMELIESYGGSDDASMAADNTSAFNCRPITGTTDRFSIHSYGQAIDINTVENPYVRGTTVLPEAGVEYLDRSDVRPGMITKNDVVEKAFRHQGFFWGGDFNSLKDYQHFETKKLALPD
ncbi:MULTISPECIES: M15 family metallopeptidase [unclassified Nocardioides]|uniref:M15 family metallopeptidase n=1 Tax=unclassified Nocardioides TaxID=2615069 RepID=UPI00360B5CE9